jgi:hypothetical protein
MKLMRTILPLPLLALSMLAQDVRYNFSSGTNFEKFKTYKWVLIKGADQPDQLTDQQIKSAIDTELSKKGLTKTAGETSDLLIGYQVSLNQEKQTTMYDSGWAYGPGWGRYGYGYGGGGITTATTSTIQIGQIDLDMYDPTAKQLVWRGTASKTLDPKASPEKRQKNLAKGVAKLLKNFPPKKKG